METEGLINHTIISIVGWLLGTTLGWGIGYASLALWRKIDLSPERIYPFALFIPWRTIVLSLLMLNYFPIFPIRWLGLGNKAGIFSIAFVIFWLTLIFVFQSAQEHQPVSRLWAWARTIAVFSVLLTAHYSMWGSGGLGIVAKEHLMLMDFDAAWAYFAWMVGIALVIDLVIASGQLHLERYAVQKEKEAG